MSNVVYMDNRVYCLESPRSGHKRTIVRVFIDGVAQLFYRSSGANSGRPGVFFPFDGLIMAGDVPVWFNKRRFVLEDEGHPLDRYGTQEMKDISDALALLNIPQGIPTDGHRVNRFIKETCGKRFQLVLTKV